jgi:DNA-binding response OmpR family regulator
VDLLLLTTEATFEPVLPGLALLDHQVHLARPGLAALLDTTRADVVLLDARSELLSARTLCRLIGTAGFGMPVIAVLAPGGLVAVSRQWGVDDILLCEAGPAEIDARLRLLRSRAHDDPQAAPDRVILGELMIEESTYSAWSHGRPLELTYKEFALLAHLARNPGRVFTRAQLLTEVWGHNVFGGTRTVDVHIRRLRAKLGREHDGLIATVRNVGYKAVRPTPVPGETSTASRDLPTLPAPASVTSGAARNAP